MDGVLKDTIGRCRAIMGNSACNDITTENNRVPVEDEGGVGDRTVGGRATIGEVDAVYCQVRYIIGRGRVDGILGKRNSRSIGRRYTSYPARAGAPVRRRIARIRLPKSALRLCEHEYQNAPRR